MTKKTIYLKDYTPHPYKITKVELEFDIFDKFTQVISSMSVERVDKSIKILELDCENIEIISININGNEIKDFDISNNKLNFLADKDEFKLRTISKIYPHKNTALEGLYKSGEIYCTQNEPEGFRRITPFIDRSDNMAHFTTKVIADKKFPQLLSNGNLKEKGDVDENRHFAIWDDPFLKPSYLFALVAGDFDVVSDSFKTMKNKNVSLNIYVDKGNALKTSHAMTSLKNAMKWDEDTFGLAYDLDYYNIVAVDSFNMGAMENKGLNIFNSHYVLASLEVATDQNFLGIESVIAHEYFHNYTGNRITCKDWFELTLKEGLTVFRDQSFSADMNSKVIQRIDDVKALRSRQFLEDAGPTAHPIKTDKYIEINNFYTATVYEKGAEVIRMMHTLLGKEAFRKGMDYYFANYDSQAVRTDDYLYSLRTAGYIDKQFELWYSQSRTPRLKIQRELNDGVLKLTLTQHIDDDVDGNKQKAMYYPLSVALFDTKGKRIELKLRSSSDQRYIDKNMIIVSKGVEVFELVVGDDFDLITFNRDFTAPIIITDEEQDYKKVLSVEDDGFTLFEAMNELQIDVVLKYMKSAVVDQDFLDTYEYIAIKEMDDLALKARLLEFINIDTILSYVNVIEPSLIVKSLMEIKNAIALRMESHFVSEYKKYNLPKNTSIDFDSISQRSYKNTILSYLARVKKESIDLLVCKQYDESLTMSDKIVALDLLENYFEKSSKQRLQNFYDLYKDDTLTMNKYFSVLASSSRDGVLQRVQSLSKDEVFDIKVPNLVRSLYGVYSKNFEYFHDKDGDSYAYIAQIIIELDSINPMIASGLASSFKILKRLESHQQKLMKEQIEKIIDMENISSNLYETVNSILVK